MSFEITIVRGRTCRYQIDLLDQEGQPLDLIAGDLTMSFMDPTTGIVEIVKDNDDGIIYDDEVTGRAELTIDNDDTADLDNNWATLYGEAVFTQDGEPFNALVGLLRIIPAVEATS